jgi:hypothetical protein
MRYLARTSPPIPDAAMQEAHWLIEANTENTRHWLSRGRGVRFGDWPWA